MTSPSCVDVNLALKVVLPEEDSAKAQAYDAHYLALAQSLACEFRTTDTKLQKTLHQELPWVRCLSDWAPSS